MCADQHEAPECIVPEDLFMHLFMNLSAHILKSYHQNSNAIVYFVCWGHGYFMNDTWVSDSQGDIIINIIIGSLAVRSPGVIHEVAVPPASKLYYGIAILVI